MVTVWLSHPRSRAQPQQVTATTRDGWLTWARLCSHVTQNFLLANDTTTSSVRLARKMTRWTTTEYTKILTESLVAYRQANSKDRLQIVKQIKAKIKDSAEQDNKYVPEDLSTVTYAFYVCPELIWCLSVHRKFAIGSTITTGLSVEGRSLLVQKMMATKAFSLADDRGGPSSVLWSSTRRGTSMPGPRNCQMLRGDQSSSSAHIVVLGLRFVKS